MKKNQGFTLIELVVVIVVLGLLAVAALPRFVDVTDSAKEASIEGVAGGFATAVLSARAQWEGNGRPVDEDDTTNYSVDYDGQDFWLTKSGGDFRDGYPISAKGAGTGFTQVFVDTVNASRCVVLMEELLQNPPSVSDTENDGSKFWAQANPTDAASSVVCRYTQQEGKGHYFDYDVTNGSVTVTLDN
ncbi:prepilin-type N-terminal cleavage/methylation domain-containing protein [Vibrio maerlii]|uniref:prepilin-type N-terminal cleavage/methylation domain-containing protein n=1 Tax=Vibrio maerlii TaxID=2231648 RepID=UPI000E3C7E07|nr:prepilin-type N-terminal cleavage/methylation domain-containing protein [Vibrio maerlii]